jgi:tRNA threonylcarbamoyladenosine biosynthesis protein TsaB
MAGPTASTAAAPATISAAMLLLALDTSADRVTAALTDFARLSLVQSDQMQRGHAEHLIPMVESLLKEAGVSLSDVTRIGVTVGPGSFTGIRIALSVARGFAIAHDIPVVGVGTLAALAASVSDTPAGPVLAVIDARRGEVFAALHAPDGEELVAPFAGDPESVLKKIGDRFHLIIGTGAAILSHHAVTTGRPRPVIDPVTTIDPRAIARLAAKADPVRSPATPLYIRPPDARPQRSPFQPLPEGGTR